MVSVLDSKVLVLNRSYLPIHVTSVRRAVTLLYQDIARAVDEQYRTFDFASWAALAAAEDQIGLVGRAIRVPRVIVLTSFDRLPRRTVRFSRFNIFARDENRCQYCGVRFGRADLNLDHVIPRAAGGRSTWENVVCSCFRCNRVKGGRTPTQAGMRLIRPPRRPAWTPFVAETFSARRYREWLPFLRMVDAAYWTTELKEE